MKRSKSIVFMLAAAFLSFLGCDSKTNTVTKGREAVKEVVTQPFNTLENAKESLTKSEDKTKAAIEEFDKESKQP
jgi:ABC-type oligopeptide transport system substrate-binding subunit